MEDLSKSYQSSILQSINHTSIIYQLSFDHPSMDIYISMDIHGCLTVNPRKSKIDRASIRCATAQRLECSRTSPTTARLGTWNHALQLGTSSIPVASRRGGDFLMVPMSNSRILAQIPLASSCLGGNREAKSIFAAT